MILTLLSFFFIFQSSAPPELPLGVPQLQLQKGDLKPSVLSKLNYDIEVLGFMAQTTLTMTLTDPDTFDQEASLLVRLPPHSLVDGFQLNIGKSMVDGVIQEKHLARIGFDREKRKRVDPGLIEWVGHNLYRIRVFPLRAGHPRQVSFRYLAPLIRENNGDVYALDFRGFDKHTKITVSLLQRDGASAPKISGHQRTTFKRTQEGQRWRFSSKKPFSQPLAFRWQQGMRAAMMVAKGSENWHFAMRGFWERKGKRALAKPESVAVFWDASNSRQKAVIEKEEKALFRLMAHRNPQSIYLIPFRDRREPAKQYTQSKEDKKRLKQDLAAMIYDGATNLRGLDMPPGLNVDEIWIFSDGHDTLGMPSDNHLLQAPVFAFSASSMAAWPFLESFSERRDGAVLYWQTPPEVTLNQLFTQNKPVVNTVQPKAGTIEDLYLSQSPATGTVLAAGVTTEHPAGFSMLSDGRSQPLVGNQIIAKEAHRSLAIDWLKRFGQVCKLENLQKEPAYYREEILDLGEEHGMVTQHSSLIVFETPQQYAANGLMPPANAPFDVGGMLDFEPTEEDLAKKKDAYFRKVAKKWKEFHNIPQSPKAKDPWDVLYSVPSIQADAINIGGNEAGASSSASAHGSEMSEMMMVAPSEELVVSAQVDLAEAGTTTDNQSGFLAESNATEAEKKEAKPTTRRVPVKPWKKVLEAIKKITSNEEQAYEQYLALKPQFANSPSFYYQTAHYFAEHNRPELARRVASNLLEQGWQDDRLLFAMGMLLHTLQDLDTALVIYKKLAQQRPEWPQARMLVAQIKREQAITMEGSNQEAAIATYLEAFQMFQDLALAPWGELDPWDQAHFLDENRFPHILITILEEGLWIQSRLNRLGQELQLKLPDGFEATSEDIKADLRVLLWWDDENADLDLWITEPEGNVVNYKTPNHFRGGRILDQVRGLGPDVYRQKTAYPGVFTIKTKYFSSVFSELMGPIYAKAELWLRYGYEDEAYRVEIHRIQEPKRHVDIELDRVTWPLQ